MAHFNALMENPDLVQKLVAQDEDTEEIVIEEQDQLVEKEVGGVVNENHKKKVTFTEKVDFISQNNWPPIPNCFCVKPCFYQNIEFDIPIQFNNFIHNLYCLWKFHILIYSLNLIGGLFLMDTNIITLGTIYLIFGSTFFYVGLFRTAYNAYTLKSSFHLMTFTYLYCVQFVITVLHTLGLPYSGLIGFGTLLNYQEGHLHIAVGAIITSIVSCAAIVNFMVILTVTTSHGQVITFFNNSREKIQTI